MKNVLLIILITLVSCASDAKWVDNDVPFVDQPWRICTKEYGDPAKYHLKGFCYWVEQTKDRLLRSSKWRRVHKVCLYTDEVCQLKFAQSGKRMR